MNPARNWIRVIQCFECSNVINVIETEESSISTYNYHMTVMYVSVIYLSHIQQEVENALEGLCNLLPSSIASEVGAPDQNNHLSIIISSVYP